MSSAHHVAELQDVHRLSQRTWDEVRLLWRDQVAAAFERESWDPVAASAKAVIGAADELDALLSAAEAECV